MPSAAPSTDTTAGQARAVFGLRLAGVERLELLPSANGEAWPEVRVQRRIAPHEVPRRGFGARRACFEFPEGRLLLERENALIAAVTKEPLADDVLVHPWLTLACGMWARWLGRDAFHGGAFLARRGAWAVLGSNGGGKSSVLAWLALHGTPVIADDLLVIDDAHVFAGARCIDLRRSTAEQLEALRLPLVRDLSRRRLGLDPIAPRTRLAGVVHLAWGDRVDVRKVPLAERIERLRGHNNFQGVPAEKRTLLHMAALPTLELRRPRDLDRLGDGARALLAALPA